MRVQAIQALGSKVVGLALAAVAAAVALPVYAADLPEAATAVTVTPAGLAGLQFEVHGYYRTRYVSMDNVPVGRLDNSGTLAASDENTHTSRDDASSAHYLHSRLRLDPSLRWGGNPAKGEAAKVGLYGQLDLMDTVVWGDNARQADVPLFAGNPSETGLDGNERASLLLRRLWLEVALPIGQLRVGRQGSQGGLGILFNDGNGFRNDFGDATGGTTFDRVLFATRPLTIYNAIKHGDKRETPLIFVLGHDWLVEDPLGFGKNPQTADTRTNAGPYGFLTTPTCGGRTEPTGTKPTIKCDNDASQMMTGLIWKDTAWNFRSKTDELQLGALYVRRSQDSTKSLMHIIDGFWRMQMGLTPGGMSLLTEGEVAIIRGSTQGLPVLAGQFSNTTGLAENVIDGDILNLAARLGVTSPTWDALVEFGHSSGDEQLIGGDFVFKMYPMHADYKVGLLMYPVALYSRSASTAAGMASGALQSGGGVFNSSYLNLKGRYRLTKETWQLELTGQGLAGWAETLNGGKTLGITADYYAPRDPANPWADNRCSAFDPTCALGVELDVAAQLKWLPADLPNTETKDKYMLRWSVEAGLLMAGKALAPRLAEGADVLTTVQSRIAFVW